MEIPVLAARPADAPGVNPLHGVVPHIHRVGATVSLSGSITSAVIGEGASLRWDALIATASWTMAD